MKKLLPILVFTIVLVFAKSSYSQEAKPNFFGFKELDVISYLKLDKNYSFYDRNDSDSEVELMYLHDIGKSATITHVYHFNKVNNKCYKITDLYPKEMFTSIVKQMEDNTDLKRDEGPLTWINDKTFVKTQINVSKTFCALSYTYTGLIK